MKTRLITAIVLLLVLAVALITLTTFIFDIIVAVFCTWAMWEIFSAAKLAKSLHIFICFTIFSAISLFTVSFISYYLLFLLLFSFVVYLALFIMKNINSENLNKILLVFALKFFVILCFFCVLYLKYYFLNNDYGTNSLYFILIALNCAWGADSSAYFAGRFFGKRKLSPEISPNKTVEGAIGGVIGSVIIGQVVTFIYANVANGLLSTSYNNLDYTFYIFISIICALGAVFGIIGDLFASSIKRVCQVKDYGSIFPGHGGIMDRFDSVTFTVPFITVSALIFISYIF